MSKYADAIITQFTRLLKSKVVLEDNNTKELRCVIKDINGRESRKIFRGTTWNEVAFEVNSFMNTNAFKEVYVWTIQPLYK
ncbi:hypothetical protein ETI05_03570 [Macrococcoides canis]|uniref:hypothetical protein n=1 Tax=Macrococcoides canis TaxID=1855823 RepID=UPI00106059DA|nr:hypothetical protein [Macrococcus canis]TDM21834.1 hypothetical protein ETI05_03570 [Macrococcus canis]